MAIKLRHKKVIFVESQIDKIDLIANVEYIVNKYNFDLDIKISIEKHAFMYAIKNNVGTLIQFESPDECANEALVYFIIAHEKLFKSIGKGGLIRDLKELAKEKAWLLT